MENSMKSLIKWEYDNEPSTSVNNDTSITPKQEQVSIFYEILNGKNFSFHCDCIHAEQMCFICVCNEF